MNAIFLFAHDCNMAARLQASNRDILDLLNLHAYQDTVTDRLEAKLNEKWHEYKQEYWDEQSSVPFRHFAKWINKETN